MYHGLRSWLTYVFDTKWFVFSQTTVYRIFFIFWRPSSGLLVSKKTDFWCWFIDVLWNNSFCTLSSIFSSEWLPWSDFEGKLKPREGCGVVLILMAWYVGNDHKLWLLSMFVSIETFEMWLKITLNSRLFLPKWIMMLLILGAGYHGNYFGSLLWDVCILLKKCT